MDLLNIKTGVPFKLQTLFQIGEKNQKIIKHLLLMGAYIT